MSGTFDLIRRLRTDAPRADAAAKAAWWFGMLCLGAGAWNVLMVTTLPLERFPLTMGSAEFVAILAAVTVSGFVALQASGRLKEAPASGARWGKVALWLWIGALVLLASTIRVDPSLEVPEFFEWFLWAIRILVFVQFVVPGWFAIGYLTRLEASSASETLVVPSDRG